MQYYYFGSSLPPLSLDTPPPFSLETFRQDCTDHLNRDDLLALDDLTAGRPSKHAFVRAWQNRDTQLRNALARARSGRLGRDATPYLRTHDGFDTVAEQTANDALGQPSPVERERVLDRFRWELTDELSRNEVFSGSAVLAYALKLSLSARWAAMDPESGSEKLQGLVSRDPGREESEESHE